MKTLLVVSCVVVLIYSNPLVDNGDTLEKSAVQNMRLTTEELFEKVININISISPHTQIFKAWNCQSDSDCNKGCTCNQWGRCKCTEVEVKLHKKYFGHQLMSFLENAKMPLRY